MSDGTNYKHDTSDRKLTQEADEAAAAAKAKSDKHGGGPGHDPDKIARHDDTGKDRLFEKREQHDDAEKHSERSRLDKAPARSDETSDA